jgi:hypothetical protein
MTRCMHLTAEFVVQDASRPKKRQWGVTLLGDLVMHARFAQHHTPNFAWDHPSRLATILGEWDHPRRLARSFGVK